MISADQALNQVPPDDVWIVSGILGESNEYWAIERESIFEPGTEEFEASEFDKLTPFVNKNSGEVTYATPVSDPQLFEGLELSGNEAREESAMEEENG